MIINIIIIFLFSFGLTYLLVPFNIRFAKKYNLLDIPNDRTIHQEAIPLAGGLSFAIPIILLQLFFYFRFPEFSSQMIKLAGGSFAILLLGYLDDKRKFTAKYKLIFQILIVIAMYFSGFKIAVLTNPFGGDQALGTLSFPLTIIWFLLIINAFNLIDGLDGLAAGIATIVSAVLLAVGIMYVNLMVIFLSITLLSGSLAFLRYNFYPAKIFMGDTGSLFLGFNIAAITVAGTAQFKGITAMTLLIPLIALVIPISDTALAIFRRIKRRKHIFQADKEHMHHKMLDAGLSQRAIALISYLITFLFGLIAFGFSFASKEILLGIFIILFILFSIFFFIIFKKGQQK